MFVYQKHAVSGWPGRALAGSLPVPVVILYQCVCVPSHQEGQKARHLCADGHVACLLAVSLSDKYRSWQTFLLV